MLAHVENGDDLARTEVSGLHYEDGVVGTSTINSQILDTAGGWHVDKDDLDVGAGVQSAGDGTVHRHVSWPRGWGRS